MDTPDETSETTKPTAGGRSAGRRRLDARTIGICVVLALVMAIFAGLVASVLVSDEGNAKTGESDPQFQLAEAVDTGALLKTPLLTTADEPTSLAAFVQDRPVVVNLWAQSCLPCVKEMPLLEKASKANPGIAFLGVDTSDRLAKAKVMARLTGITYPWVQDPAGDFFVEAKAAGLPTTFIIQPSGEIVGTKTGAFKSLTELQRWLEEHVA